MTTPEPESPHTPPTTGGLLNKGKIMNRLSKAGLRDAAEAYRDEVRHRIGQAQGGKKRNRNEVSTTAWIDMWEIFRPVVEQWEKDQQPDDPPLAGCTDNLDQFLDPDYTETDPGKWLRDGLIWTAAEIRRVVLDSENATTVDLTRAKTLPPTAWAVFCLETFARKSPEKRGDLIARVLPFATRSHDTPDNGPPKDGGFLDSIS